MSIHKYHYHCGYRKYGFIDGNYCFSSYQVAGYWHNAIELPKRSSKTKVLERKASRSACVEESAVTISLHHSIQAQLG